MTPQRLRLSRAKGARLPAGAISVARPSRWGNPWPVGDVIGSDVDAPDRYRGVGAVITPEIAVALYRSALVGSSPRWRVGLWIDLDDVRRELRGHDLACWCPLDQPCHADVLIELANGD